MNLNQLEYFVSVAETLNFTRAAERCFISQTAMSQQIKVLEETVGVPLLIRNKHKVELTAAGKVYYNEARAILERSGNAIHLARTAAEGAEGSISIGYIRGYGQKDFARQLQKFRHANPNVKVSLTRDNMSPLIDQLENGNCDVIFTSSPHSWSKYPQLEHEIVGTYPLMVVVPSNHWLAGHSTIEYSELQEEKFIIMQPSGRPTDEMEESLMIYEKGGFVPNIVSLHQDPEEILFEVSIGLGISFMPEYMIRLHQNSSEFHIAQLVNADGAPEMHGLELVWKKGNTNPIINQLKNSIK
ncbi:MAG: LysR family transcriptional regulator [Clostridia bacterium]|nr:LysR family transcriptional regulator [Clostridia bacterium]